MTQITRTFDTAAQAKAAVEELKKRRFDAVELVETGDRRPGNSGGALVRVEAPFGTAVAVTEVLERNGGKRARSAGPAAAETAPQPPAAKPQPQPGKPQPKPDMDTQTAKPSPATARSSRTELRSGPRTLSQMLGIPELIDADTFFSGFPLLIRSAPKHRAEAKPD